MVGKPALQPSPIGDLLPEHGARGAYNQRRLIFSLRLDCDGRRDHSVGAHRHEQHQRVDVFMGDPPHLARASASTGVAARSAR